jgi:hypothetical protein
MHFARGEERGMPDDLNSLLSGLEPWPAERPFHRPSKATPINSSAHRQGRAIVVCE